MVHYLYFKDFQDSSENYLQGQTVWCPSFSIIYVMMHHYYYDTSDFLHASSCRYIPHVGSPAFQLIYPYLRPLGRILYSGKFTPVFELQLFTGYYRLFHICTCTMKIQHRTGLPMFPYFYGQQWWSFKHTFLASPSVTDVRTIIIHALHKARFRFSGYDFTWLLATTCSDMLLPAGVSTRTPLQLWYASSVLTLCGKGISPLISMS